MKRITPCERVWKTLPETGVFSCVPFCLRSLGRFARCVKRNHYLSKVETETGDIRIASSYCDQAKFCTNRGNMHLRNIHNESYIAIYEQGDLKIQGIDGSTNIFVKQVRHPFLHSCQKNSLSFNRGPTIGKSSPSIFISGWCRCSGLESVTRISDPRWGWRRPPQTERKLSTQNWHPGQWSCTRRKVPGRPIFALPHITSC